MTGDQIEISNKLWAGQGDEVWFNRGFGPERGTVWAHGRGHLAIGIGRVPHGAEPVERIILPADDVYGREEEVPPYE